MGIRGLPGTYAFRRVSWTKDPLQRQTTFGYDKAGNRTLVTDASGRTETMAYDAADQLKTVDYSDPGTPDVTDTVYDDVGQRLGHDHARPDLDVGVGLAPAHDLLRRRRRRRELRLRPAQPPEHHLGGRGAHGDPWL